MKTFRPTVTPSESDLRVRCSIKLINDVEQHNLTDKELLSMLFSVVLQEQDTCDLAHTVLQSFGSIGQLVRASRSDLHEVLAHDERLVKSIRILWLCLERIVSERTTEQIRVNSPTALTEYVAAHKNLASSGYRRVAFLDRDTRLVRDQSMSMRQSELEACRDIAQVALEVDAFGLIVIEYLYRKIVQPNHRSINLNKTIHQAMSNIDIILYDYLIVGIDQFYSFKQENTINF